MGNKYFTLHNAIIEFYFMYCLANACYSNLSRCRNFFKSTRMIKLKLDYFLSSVLSIEYLHSKQQAVCGFVKILIGLTRCNLEDYSLALSQKFYIIFKKCIHLQHYMNCSVTRQKTLVKWMPMASCRPYKITSSPTL